MVTLIRTAVDQGVTFFDTAEAYGPLESERIVGEALSPCATGGHRLEVRLRHRPANRATPRRTQQPPRPHPQAVDRMLQRLRTDRIDLLYQHRVDPKCPSKTWQAP